MGIYRFAIGTLRNVPFFYYAGYDKTTMNRGESMISVDFRRVREY